MTDVERIALFIAAGGLLLSIFLAVRRYWKSRPNIKIYYEIADSGALSKQIVNEGERPVTIVLVGYLNKRGEPVTPKDHKWLLYNRLPRTLTYGDSIEWTSDPRELERASEITHAFAQDATGKRYKFEVPIATASTV